MLCTDGLWNYAQEPAELGRMLEGTAELLDVARRMIDFANARGGDNDLTVVLLRVSRERAIVERMRYVRRIQG